MSSNHHTLARSFFAMPLLLLLLPALPVYAADAWPQPTADDLAALSPAEAGYAVMAAVEARDAGFNDLQVALTMRLRTRGGRESLRTLRIDQLEIPGDGDRLLLVFETPKAIRGTALLSHAHRGQEDDQWLWLPAANRVRKIASKNRSSPFVGSEFSFEDLSAPELSDYRYRYLGLEPCGAADCFVVELVPVDAFSGYSRQELRIHAQELRIEAADYFDKGGRLLKQLTHSGYELYEGRYWRSTVMLMVNRKTGRSTELEWRDFRFGTGLTMERDFSVASLRRQR